MGGDIRLTAGARGEPPMMDRSFVPGDQPLALEGSQSEFWCIKLHQVPGRIRLLRPPLRTREFHPPGAQTPNKALYSLFLWLIGFYSSGEPKKTFQYTIITYVHTHIYILNLLLMLQRVYNN